MQLVSVANGWRSWLLVCGRPGRHCGESPVSTAGSAQLRSPDHACPASGGLQSLCQNQDGSSRDVRPSRGSPPRSPTSPRQADFLASPASAPTSVTPAPTPLADPAFTLWNRDVDTVTDSG